MKNKYFLISFVSTILLLFGGTYWFAKYKLSDLVSGVELNSSVNDLYVKDYLSNSTNICVEKKYKLINLWATWCKPCVKELPELIKFKEEYSKKCTFYFISNQERSDIDKLCNNKKFEKNNFFQFEKSTNNDINFFVLPKSILLDENNKIIWQKTSALDSNDFEKIKKLLH